MSEQQKARADHVSSLLLALDVKPPGTLDFLGGMILGMTFAQSTFELPVHWHDKQRMLEREREIMAGHIRDRREAVRGYPQAGDDAQPRA